MPTAQFYLSPFLFFFLLPISFSTRCHPKNDKKTLLRIKKALNNPYLLASWDPSTDCCDWYCVKCDLQSNRVVNLDISNGELSAQIPPSIADLPYLDTLILRKLSNLTGEIPPSITKLRNLRMVRLSWTNLSGSIPQSLSTLQNLFYLDLSFNNFSGEIPASLANLTNLSALHLDRNRLTGQIPASFGHFAGSVPDLYLSHNQLEGPIPASLGNLDFSVLDLLRNKLVGDASMLFQNPARSTRWIDVSRNLLEFDVSGARFPTSMTALDISHNRIRGNIPSQITELGELVQFNASYNQLCGEIPQGGGMQGFDATVYFHNRCLCGPPLQKCASST